MRRFQLASDLHLEWYKDGGRHLLETKLRWDDTSDAVILAGDIGGGGDQIGTIEFALQFFSEKFPRVLYVPGNHEFYYGKAQETLDAIRLLAAKYPKVTLLEPGVIATVGDRRVIGCTLWFPFRTDNIRYKRDLTDFKLIKDFEPWVYEQNKAHVAWLTETMKEGDMVVTHHLPSEQSVGPRYKGDPLNRFFLCDMEKLIVERRPAFWAHGHTHDSFRYLIGPTLVACNPHGYPRQENPKYVGFTANLPE